MSFPLESFNYILAGVNKRKFFQAQWILSLSDAVSQQLTFAGKFELRELRRH